MGEITVNLVRDAVHQMLGTNFPDVEILSEEIGQAPQAPCFFVKLIQSEQHQELGNRYRRVHSFDIHYFDADSRNMHDMAERLYDIMELITVNSVRYRGTGMRYEITDGVLHFFVNYNFRVRRSLPESPFMQTMKQEGYIN